MNRTSLVTVGVIALTATILGTAPTVSAAMPAPASAVETVADQPTPGHDAQANGTRSGRAKPTDGNVFTPPVRAAQPTVTPYGD